MKIFLSEPLGDTILRSVMAEEVLISEPTEFDADEDDVVDPNNDINTDRLEMLADLYGATGKIPTDKGQVAEVINALMTPPEEDESADPKPADPKPVDPPADPKLE